MGRKSSISLSGSVVPESRRKNGAEPKAQGRRRLYISGGFLSMVCPQVIKKLFWGTQTFGSKLYGPKKNDYIYAIPMNGRFKTYIAHVVIFDFSGYGGSMALYMFQFA